MWVKFFGGGRFSRRAGERGSPKFRESGPFVVVGVVALLLTTMAVEEEKSLSEVEEEAFTGCCSDAVGVL